MAARIDERAETATRRTFLVAAAGIAAALVVGRVWRQRGGHTASPGASRPRRADNLRETVHASGVELRPTPVDPHGPVFRLNRSAALVWRHVDGRRTVDDLAALLASAYGLSFAAARTDTLACLQTLSGQGLVCGVTSLGGRAGGPA